MTKEKRKGARHCPKRSANGRFLPKAAAKVETGVALAEKDKSDAQQKGGVQQEGEGKGKKLPSPKQIERQVRLVLTELMNGSDSDSVRIAAAKALMEKLTRKPEDDDTARAHDNEEQAAAIHEARELLAALAASQFGRAARKGALA